MAKYIKNTDNTAKTWCGQEVAAGSYYLLESIEEAKWANDSTVMQSITSGTLLVSESDSSAGHITDYASAINFLKGNVLDIDEQGRQVNRVAAGSKGWSYLAHPFEFETSKIGSGYAKDYLGNDRGDLGLKFYKADGTEVTNSADESLITKTVLTWSPNYDYELISGSIRQLATATSDVRLWVIGGITDLGGAYVKEFAGGLNLRYIGQDEEIKTDGRAAKYMKKTITGVPYNANKIQIIVKHDAGIQHKIMIILEYFRA